MRSIRMMPLVAVVLSLAWTVSAHAGATASMKCQAAKLKAAGKGCDCRHGAAAKALTSGDPPDFTKCAGKLSDAFAKAESKGGCPATGEGTTVDGRLVTLVNDLETALQTGSASGDAAVACAAAKLKAAGKKCACVHGAQAKAALKGIAPDFSKCDAKLDSAYAKAEAKAGGVCPTTGDADAICDAIEGQLAEIEADVADRDTTSYAARGSFGVGYHNVTLTDTTRTTPANGTYPGAPDRTLVTTIWYPTDNHDAAQVLDAPFTANGGGPRPLIIRAHGFSGFRTDSLYMVQHLASRGYIVVAPDFPLSNLNAPGGPTLADIDKQAGDVSFMIDYAIAENTNSSSFLSGHVDTDKIGAIGHSLGGATVLLATYHPTVRDPRIDATVALSPLGCVFLDNFFDTVNTPLMIEGGTVDLITPYNSNHLQPYGLANAPKYLVTMDGGTHLGFADRLLFAANENGDEEVGCPLFIQPGDPRPKTIDPGLPPDYLGGPPDGVDPSGSMCEAICPPPPASFMLHARQNTLAKAASLAFFDAKFFGSISAKRMITGRIDTDNTDVTLSYSE